MLNSKNQTPKPTKRNPFKAGSYHARMFDGTLKAYADGHRDVVRGNGAVRCMGNSMAVAFWRGYDGTQPCTIQRESAAWACYRAGQTQRIADTQRGVFVPPTTNSIVKVSSLRTSAA